MAAPIEGYASVTSAAAGETVDFHVRADGAHRTFTMEIVRRGAEDKAVASAQGEAFVPGAQDDAALAVAGCDWPAVASCRTVIPADWRSGYYVAQLSAGGASTEIPFVVRSAAPGTTSKIVLKLSDSTTQAYTSWGARSFYTTAPHAPAISYDRPYDNVQGLYEIYQLPLIGWAEKNGIDLEYCSSLDLHTDPAFLAPYRLMISLGHDEYWSLEMRDQVEAFIASGGNVVFLSANTCYWQVRLDLSGGKRIMTSYKDTEAGRERDPERNGGDPRRITCRWYEAPVLRPETRLTGVSYRYGAGWWNDPIVPAKRFRGYTVANAGHWIFEGTGFKNGDTFGAGNSVETTMLGYETDATGDGTPHGFTVLASADLRDWAAGGQGGGATMGLYRRNGSVVTGGTVNWVAGLSDDGDSAPVDWITQNMLRGLSGARPARLSVPNPGFEQWANGVPAGWVRDGAGTVADEPADAAAAANEMRFSPAGQHALRVDATHGETWISAANLACAGAKRYGAGCWVKSPSSAASVRLQTTDTWADFATASHSGSGEWEYVYAEGSPGRGAQTVPARVKLQVAAGGHAVYDNVEVIEIPDRGA